MPDVKFDDPRLAPLYDLLDPDRSDLDPYLSLAEGLGARSVLDVGCGTGTFAILLAQRGLEVTGVDPAGASLDVARGKKDSDLVTWVHGDATDLPPLEADLATMTANVAQVFLTDESWAETLAAVHAALRPGGHLVFETRVPAQRAWESWSDGRTTTQIPGLGPLTTWNDIIDVREHPLLVTFAAHHLFPDGEDIVSVSTLRFRTQVELDTSLAAAGFEVAEVRDAADRPGRELVYLARRV